MTKPINWELKVSDELNEVFEKNILRAHWRKLTKFTIYWFYAEYNNKKVTLTWTGEGFNSGLVWAWGKFSGDEILKDLILKKYRFS